jgi:hypothetical protein
VFGDLEEVVCSLFVAPVEVCNGHRTGTERFAGSQFRLRQRAIERRFHFDHDDGVLVEGLADDRFVALAHEDEVELGIV